MNGGGGGSCGRVITDHIVDSDLCKLQNCHPDMGINNDRGCDISCLIVFGGRTCSCGEGVNVLADN